MQAVGLVEVLNLKTTTKAGKHLRTPLYSFMLNGEWYSCGFDNPNIQKGDNVEFDYTVGEFGSEVTSGTVKKMEGGAAPVVQGKPIPADQRQLSIVYQSSRKDAIQVLNLLVEQGVITLPKKTGYEVMMDLVDELTMDFAQKALSPTIVPVVPVEVVDDE